jgi:hypothetical protein
VDDFLDHQLALRMAGEICDLEQEAEILDVPVQIAGDAHLRNVGERNDMATAAGRLAKGLGSTLQQG